MYLFLLLCVDSSAGVGVQKKGSSCSILLKILLIEGLVLSPFSVRLPEKQKQCMKILRSNSPELQTGRHCRHHHLHVLQACLTQRVPNQISHPPPHPFLLQSSTQCHFQVQNLEILIVSLLIPHSPGLICRPLLWIRPVVTCFMN